VDVEMMLLVVEGVLEAVGLGPLLRLLDVATSVGAVVAALVGVVGVALVVFVGVVAVAFRLLVVVAALVGVVAVAFVVFVGIGFAAGLLSNVTPFKKKDI
jgi:hypothetical protein